MITNISTLKKNLDNYITSVTTFNEPIIVTTKNGNVVIASENEYNTMSESIHLVSQKNLVKKIKEGEKEDISKMPAYSPNAKW